mmetsp:Transcript_30548/g.83939  ORF Transcript_30548/g.83939 Transcript_30548/m.83939 type:complete len:217 (+) Transcript_30548:573-1223(+)
MRLAVPLSISGLRFRCGTTSLCPCDASLEGGPAFGFRRRPSDSVRSTNAANDGIHHTALHCADLLLQSRAALRKYGVIHSMFGHRVRLSELREHFLRAPMKPLYALLRCMGLLGRQNSETVQLRRQLRSLATSCGDRSLHRGSRLCATGCTWRFQRCARRRRRARPCNAWLPILCGTVAGGRPISGAEHVGREQPLVGRGWHHAKVAHATHTALGT